MRGKYIVLLAIALIAVATARATARQNAPQSVTESAAIPYTVEQAQRGQMLFRRHCLFCHSTSKSNDKSPNEPLRGALVGTRRGVMNVGGRQLVNVYPTVYHVYARIREGMPAWDIDAVSPAQKVDIVAYLLQENGIPPNGRELPLDTEAMKKMRLRSDTPWTPEPGFEPIFNGRDFTNLKFFFGYNCTLPPGCAKTEPSAFSVKDGVIVANGRYHGYMYTEKRYLNFDLRLDLRVEPPPDQDLDDEFLNGGGMGLFVIDHAIWGTSIEVEGAFERLLHPYGLGVPIEAKWDKDAWARANKGPGPWNSVQIVSKNGHVDLFLNGTKVSEITKHPFTEPGHIAFQYQGGTWMWRRLRIKAE